MQAQTKHTCSLWIPSQLQPQMSKGLHWKWYRDKITNISEILKSQGHQVAPCPLKNRWLQRVQKPSCFPEGPQESSLSVRQQLAVCSISHTQHLCLVLKSWRRAQITVIRADRGTRAMEAAHLWSQTLITSTPRTTSTLRLAGAMRHRAGLYLISTAPFPWDVAFFFPLTFLSIYLFIFFLLTVPAEIHDTCVPDWPAIEWWFLPAGAHILVLLWDLFFIDQSPQQLNSLFPGIDLFLSTNLSCKLK